MKKLFFFFIALVLLSTWSCDRQPDNANQAANTSTPAQREQRSASPEKVEENMEQVKAKIIERMAEVELTEEQSQKLDASLNSLDLQNMTSEERKNAIQDVAKDFRESLSSEQQSAVRSSREGSDRPNRKTATDWLNRSLSGAEYTTEQKAQIESIKAKYNFDAMPDGTDKRKVARDVLMEIINNVLTEEQRHSIQNKNKRRSRRQ